MKITIIHEKVETETIIIIIIEKMGIITVKIG